MIQIHSCLVLNTWLAFCYMSTVLFDTGQINYGNYEYKKEQENSDYLQIRNTLY